MKKHLLFILEFTIVALCFSKEIKLPFTCNEQGLILMTFSDNEYQYNFSLDTASTENVLFQTGYSKLTKTLGIDIVDIEAAVREYVTGENPDLSEAEIKEITQNYIYSGGMTFSLSELKNNNFCSSEVSFSYNPTVDSPIDDQELDGMINLAFFCDADNIIIDYKHKLLIINSKKKLKYSVPMQKYEVLCLYGIDISIDGIQQQALIDTGASCFFLREQYESTSRINEDDLLVLLEQNEIFDDNEEQIKNVKLQIGKYKTKITAIYPNINNYDATDSAKQIIRKINLLGYEVFKNHKIQFDFDNMEFRIE
jgi:hypothetical protein